MGKTTASKSLIIGYVGWTTTVQYNVYLRGIETYEVSEDLKVSAHIVDTPDGENLGISEIECKPVYLERDVRKPLDIHITPIKTRPPFRQKLEFESAYLEKEVSCPDITVNGSKTNKTEIELRILENWKWYLELFITILTYPLMIATILIIILSFLYPKIDPGKDKFRRFWFILWIKGEMKKTMKTTIKFITSPQIEISSRKSDLVDRDGKKITIPICLKMKPEGNKWKQWIKCIPFICDFYKERRWPTITYLATLILLITLLVIYYHPYYFFSFKSIIRWSTSCLAILLVIFPFLSIIIPEKWKKHLHDAAQFLWKVFIISHTKN
ncbi:MAG: hypothetical protein AB1414_07840 [bacterium]